MNYVEMKYRNEIFFYLLLPFECGKIMISWYARGTGQADIVLYTIFISTVLMFRWMEKRENVNDDGFN